MDGVLTLAQLAAELGVPRSTLSKALLADAPELRVDLLPQGSDKGRGGNKGAWGVKVEDVEKIKAVLAARKARRGKGRAKGAWGVDETSHYKCEV